MSSQRPADIFRTLPVELMIEILQYIDDFYSVVSLTKASPHAESVCATYALPILNRLTKWHSLFHCPYSYRSQCVPMPIRGIFRCLALMLSEPPSNIESVKRHFQYTQDCPWSVVPIPLCPKRAAKVAFELIRIAGRIQRLACMCLLTMVGSLHCAVSSSKLLGPDRATQFIPFSWVEEYRVYQALWNLQLYSTYLHYTQEKWGWSTQEAQALSIEIPWQFKSKGQLDEEIPSVTTVLIQLGLIPKRIAHLPLFDFDDMEETLDHGGYPSSCAWSPPPVSELEYFLGGYDFWGQSVEQALIRVSKSAIRWEFMTDRSPMPNRLLHPAVTFRMDGPERPLFQGMGLFIWDEWRMCAVGLICPRPSQRESGLPRGPDGKPIDLTPFLEDFYSWNEKVIYERWWSLLGQYPDLLDFVPRDSSKDHSFPCKNWMSNREQRLAASPSESRGLIPLFITRLAESSGYEDETYDSDDNFHDI
ncbi:hypothetical protein N7509_001291 [Penicillium cosmopolitanum]|uniref:F-box domain-containing protein n=1 Tax=Penicillium cosmopolitanum TaxID=1131564 RepID=A0A9X0BF15_9EURO|nr:uncharacterized protein N7509_001291 [Penicillium cosmopolitanum]KAJ5414664.1 hypothetical protein N7509_001291 [Penicillium cosmopolitanum]